MITDDCKYFFTRNGKRRCNKWDCGPMPVTTECPEYLVRCPEYEPEQVVVIGDGLPAFGD